MTEREFRFAEHAAIADLLASMNAELLADSRCYFGGGTSIVLKHGEYRLSRDVGFLCADPAGYRALRGAAVEKGPTAFFGRETTAVREFRSDQYGIRTMLRHSGQVLRFEIVREARIALDGLVDAELGVPLLALDDQFAEKLLANADRCFDRGAASRDAVDLGCLARAHGGIPAASLRKAESAYGEDVRRKLEAATSILEDDVEARRVADALAMRQDAVDAAAAGLRAALSTLGQVASPSS